jgi:hypothetical protein
MLKAVMRSTGEHKIRSAQLFDVAKSLELAALGINQVSLSGTNVTQHRLEYVRDLRVYKLTNKGIDLNYT